MFRLIRLLFSTLAKSARGLRAQLAQLTPDVLEIGAGLRDLFANPGLDVATALTPGGLDNALLAAIRLALAQLFPESQTRARLSDADAIQAHVKEIARLSRPVRDAIAAKLAATIIRERHGDMRQNEADLLVQLAISANRAGAPLR